MEKKFTQPEKIFDENDEESVRLIESPRRGFVPGEIPIDETLSKDHFKGERELKESHESRHGTMQMSDVTITDAMKNVEGLEGSENSSQSPLSGKSIEPMMSTEAIPGDPVNSNPYVFEVDHFPRTAPPKDHICPHGVDELGVVGASKTQPIPKPRRKRTAGKKGATSQVLKTYLVTNLLDVDEQAVYFWMKTLTGVWPRSIQLSADESQAIVKMSSECTIDDSKLISASGQPEFHLHGEQLMVTQVAPTSSIQVTCSCEQSTMVEKDTLEAYFSNARYTGVTNVDSLKRVKSLGPHEGLQVFVVTYSDAKDVESVLQRKPHKHGRYRFDVAEYHPDVGVCSLDSLCLYQTSSKNQADDETPQTPVLHIKDFDESEIDPTTLELFMSNRRKYDGGDISLWKVKRVPKGLSSVQVIYKDPSVAERVYNLYRERGLSFGKHDLHLELELPWLTENHDDKKVRVSGLTNDLDPEKFKFYLSSLSDNVVAEMFFDESQTKAVAVFQRPIDYSKIIQQSRLTAMKDLPQLKISQEFKTRCLVAVGKLTKEDIELPLESMLQNGFNKEVDVVAEEFAGTTNMWKIVTNPEVLEYILEQKKANDSRLKRIQSISPYSEFLGLHVTSGVQKRTQKLSNLVSDQLMLRFLLQVPAGQKALSEFLRTLGLSLTSDGCISNDPTSKEQGRRTVSKTWRQLKPSLLKFIDDRFLTYRCDPLTQQVHTKTEPMMIKLFSGQPITTSDEVMQATSVGSQIAFAGAKDVVANLKSQLLQIIATVEQELKEEKSVTTVVVPNILEFQIEYMNLTGFFDEMKQKHKLKSFTGEVSLQHVKIRGLPVSLDAVQKEMLKLLPQVSNSKVSCTKKPIFLDVFKTNAAKQAIKQQFDANQLSAVYIIRNKTVSIYSDSKANSQKAMDYINDMVWEAQYPPSAVFDKEEKTLLDSSSWPTKRSQLLQRYKPLEIVEMKDQSGLSIAGLKKFQSIVMEEIPQFFDLNVKRTTSFVVSQGGISFLENYRIGVFRDLEKDHNVTIDKAGAPVSITGTKDDIVNCQRALMKHLDAICKTSHTVDNPAMTQYINDDPECLTIIGLKTKCLVIPHVEERKVAGKPPVPERPPRSILSINDCRYSVTLCSGTICEVRKGDITTLPCDGIVNPANGHLTHVNGLAAAVIKRGGSVIQQECTGYVQRNGALMEGQVYTSSAGSLKCKKVIHAVGPRWKGGSSQEERTLFICIDNCFNEADNHNLTSLAIPPISTGIFGYPLDQAVKTIVEVVNSRENQGSFLPQKIVFADNKEDSLRMFEDQLRAHYDVKTPPKPKLSKRLHEPASPKNKPVAGVSSCKYVINGDTISILNRMNVEVKKGDISNSQEDVLVNSVDNQLDLSTGKVAQAIAAKAGPQLQAACSALAPINTGEVKSTQGFGLACRQVLHCNCPQYQGTSSLQELRKVIIKCLMQAAANGHQSIAFPALGTGGLQYPEADVAKEMMQAFFEYAENNANSSLTKITIVVYHRDKKTQQGFDRELQRLKGAANTTSFVRRNLEPKPDVPDVDDHDKLLAAAETTGSKKSVNPSEVIHSVKVKATTVRVVHGDIVKHTADVLLNNTDGKLNERGLLGKRLLEKAGEQVRQEVKQLSSTVSPEDIRVSKAGQLSATHIFHVDSKQCEGSTIKWADLLEKCFRRCSAMDVTSIAIAFSLTDSRISPKKMAATILESIDSYTQDKPTSLLKTVDVVILKRKTAQEFVQAIRKIENKSSTLPRRFLSGMRHLILCGSSASAEHPNNLIDAETQPTKQLLVGQQEKLLLDIYGEKNTDIEACKIELENLFRKAVMTVEWSNKPTYKNDQQYIAKLSPTQINQLRRSAKTMKVELTITAKPSDIKLVGLSKEVHCMSEKIASELKKLERREQEEKEGKLIAKITRWQYKERAGDWSDFEATTNKALEETYEENPEADYTYQVHGGLVKLDLSSMTGTEPDGVQFEIRRVDMSKNADSIALPSHWKPPLGQYSEVPLVPDTQEYKTVENDFMRTLGSGGSNVLEITRVQNPGQYQQYAVLRKTVAKKLNRQESQVETVPLWHGTDADTVSKITSGRFDRGLSGKNATALGTGSYFAKKSSYSAQPIYSRPNAQGHKYIIQARVVTGEWCKGDSDLRAAPYKPDSSTDQFDSVVDNPTSPSIFVVFHDASAYAEYIIRFS